MNKRTTYSTELKAKLAVKLISNEETIAEISDKYNINQSILRKWKAEAIEGIHKRFKGDEEVKTLKKEHDLTMGTLNKKIETLTSELDWLKKKSDEFTIIS